MTDFHVGQAVRVVRDVKVKYQSGYPLDQIPAVGDVGWVAEVAGSSRGQNFVVFVSGKSNCLPYAGREGWWLRKGEIEAVETETNNE